MLVTEMLQFTSWRVIFAVFGTLGFVWSGVWYFWFRDDPAEHPEVNSAELELIMAGREDKQNRPETSEAVGWEFWRRLLVSRNMRALCIAYFPNSFVFYFCVRGCRTISRRGTGLMPCPWDFSRDFL